jgi:integrase
MDVMPRPRPPYLSREVTRHGKAVWYVRRDGKRIRINAEYGTPEFGTEYQAALAGAPKSKDAPGSGTLAWLIERYRETAAWQELSLATRKQRESILKQIIDSAGNKPISSITSFVVNAGRDRRAHSPHQARRFLDALRGLFRWTHDAQLVKVDPTAGIKNPAKKDNGGYRPWTEEDVAAYEFRWPIGTRQRVWLDVLLYTGLRRGDAVQLGRQHVRDGVATLKTEKTGTVVTLPILPVLAETLAAGPCGDLAFICGARGEPMAKKSFSNDFADACRAANVPGSAHGVRKIAATRAANAGATVAQLEAIFGWSGAAWHRCIPVRPIGAGWRYRQCTRSRTTHERLMSHPRTRLSHQGNRANKTGHI